jgi:hypothetical protein
MTTKTTIWIGILIGSTIGGWVPTIFGASWLSLWSVVGNGVGGLLGIWAGYKIGQALFGE